MNENKNEEGMPGTSRQSIRMDILMFKEDILKDMRGIQKTLDGKYMKTDENLTYKINNFENKINLLEKKIFELSNKINTDNKIKENIDSLNQFKEETSDTIFKRRAKFNEFEKRMNEEINRINDLLIDSVIYPGIIGNSTKFKSFHDYMDYTLEEISQFRIFKDKSGLDIGPYKKKIENSIEAFKLQMNTLNNTLKDYTKSSIELSEERIKSLLKIYDDRLQDTRVENSHYSMGLEKKSEELKNEISNLKRYQEKIIKKFEKYTNEEIFNNYNIGLNNMNNKINTLVLILKDILDNKIPEKKTKVYSGVKQYIHGYLNANELTTMKAFHKEKSKNNDYDEQFANKILNNYDRLDGLLKLDIFNNNINKNNNNYLKDSKEHLKILLKQKSLKLKNNMNEIESDNNNDKTKNKKHIVTDMFQAMNNDNNIQNKLEKKQIFNEKSFSRRFTYSLGMLKVNNKDKFEEDERKEQNINNKNNITIKKVSNEMINEKKKDNINLSTDNDLKKDSINEESKNDNLYSIKTSKKTEFTIKEEEENNMTDTSGRRNNEKNESIIKDKNIDKENIGNKVFDENNKNINKDFNKNKKDNIMDNIKKNNNNFNQNIKNNIKNMKLDINNRNNSFKKEIIPKLDIRNNFKKESKTENINKNLIEKTNNKLNSFNSMSKSDINNNINNNYKTSSVKKNEHKNRNPSSSLFEYNINEINSVRSQSSKKRNANLNNNVLFNNNIIIPKSVKSSKKDNVLYSSYNNYNTFSNFNYNNGVNQNLPKLIKEQKLKSISNSENKKHKIIKFNGLNDNVSQTLSAKNYINNSINKNKKLKFGSQDFSLNGIMLKKNNRVIKNKLTGFRNEKSIEARQIENMFINLQSYIPHYGSNISEDDEIYRNYKNIKSYQSQSKFM